MWSQAAEVNFQHYCRGGFLLPLHRGGFLLPLHWGELPWPWHKGGFPWLQHTGGFPWQHTGGFPWIWHKGGFPWLQHRGDFPWLWHKGGFPLLQHRGSFYIDQLCHVSRCTLCRLLWRCIYCTPNGGKNMNCSHSCSHPWGQHMQWPSSPLHVPSATYAAGSKKSGQNFACRHRTMHGSMPALLLM